ncbi:hypothetical protein ACVST6_23135, partial [Yersinia enterocolitica]
PTDNKTLYPLVLIGLLRLLGSDTEDLWRKMENFKRALDAHKIGIPYPQMDVHLHQVDKAESAPTA